MSGPFQLHAHKVGSLPIVNHFLGRLRLDDALERHVPATDARLRLAPAAALGVVVRNLIVAHQPVYALGEWARAYHPALLGLGPGEAGLLNDDRVGRALDRLFDADRATLLTEVVLQAVRAFGIDCSQLHNDSTTVTVTGDHADATGYARGGKPTAVITHGHNKDFRPDLKQLLWILTVSADGAVPIACRVADGNTEDSSTHIPTWDELVALVGNTQFLYVADCKLATRANMDHIHGHGGRFVTVMPRTRREDTWFRDWVTRNTPTWVEASCAPARRRTDPPDVMATFEAPLGSAEGHRIIWVHSTRKAVNDAATRARRIERATAALEALAARLAGPKSRITTRVVAEDTARAALDDLDAARYFDITISPTKTKDYTAEHRGNPGPDTRFRQNTKIRFTLTWRLRQHTVRHDAASDGCFPLITNDTTMTPAAILAAYKYQPNLERRNHCLKSHQAVAPVNLHSPARIEALLCCHFFALLTHALIERQARTAMAAANLKTIPLYPEERDCPAPSGTRILQIFDSLNRQQITSDGATIQVFEPDLDALQRPVLKLLGIPASAYHAR